jgi:hypothetical protein
MVVCPLPALVNEAVSVPDGYVALLQFALLVHAVLTVPFQTPLVAHAPVAVNRNMHAINAALRRIVVFFILITLHCETTYTYTLFINIVFHG